MTVDNLISGVISGIISSVIVSLLFMFYERCKEKTNKDKIFKVVFNKLFNLLSENKLSDDVIKQLNCISPNIVDDIDNITVFSVIYEKLFSEKSILIKEELLGCIKLLITYLSYDEVDLLFHIYYLIEKLIRYQHEFLQCYYESEYKDDKNFIDILRELYSKLDYYNSLERVKYEIVKEFMESNHINKKYNKLFAVFNDYTFATFEYKKLINIMNEKFDKYKKKEYKSFVYNKIFRRLYIYDDYDKSTNISDKV